MSIATILPTSWSAGQIGVLVGKERVAATVWGKMGG
jgi:hypothetical protein